MLYARVYMFGPGIGRGREPPTLHARNRAQTIVARGDIFRQCLRVVDLYSGVHVATAHETLVASGHSRMSRTVRRDLFVDCHIDILRAVFVGCGRIPVRPLKGDLLPSPGGRVELPDVHLPRQDALEFVSTVLCWAGSTALLTA